MGFKGELQLRPWDDNDIIEGFARVFDNFAVAAGIVLFTYVGDRIALSVYEALAVFGTLSGTLLTAALLRRLKK